MTRSLHSNWLDLALSLLVTVAEAAMVAPWLYLIAGLSGHVSSPVPSPLGLVFIGFVSYWGTRYYLHGGWDLSAARALSLVTWLILMIVWYGVSSGQYFSAPWHFLDQLFRLNGGLIVMLIVGGVAWWRAISIGSEPNPFTPEFTRRLIWRGVFVGGSAVVVSVVAGGPTATRVSDSAAFALPLLIIASLLAAGAAQAAAARAQVRSGADPVRVGLGTAGGLTLAVIVLAVAITGLAGRQFWSQLARPLHAVQRGLELTLYGVLLAFSYLLFLLLTPVFWLLHLLIGKQAPKPPQAQQQAGQLKQVAQSAHAVLPPFVTTLLEILMVAFVVALVFWLILRSLRRYRAAQEEPGVEEIHESVWSSDLALNQLRSWLHGLGSRPAGLHRQHTFDLDVEPVDVRDAFRHLLALGDREGQARRTNESANDYVERLRVAWAGAGEPLDDLTVRYLAARYAEQSSERDTEQARQDWRRIRRMFMRD